MEQLGKTYQHVISGEISNMLIVHKTIFQISLIEIVHEEESPDVDEFLCMMIGKIFCCKNNSIHSTNEINSNFH